MSNSTSSSGSNIEVELPCGSQSTSRVRHPPRARPAARLTALKDLPTPPLWFAIAITSAFTAVTPLTRLPRLQQAADGVRVTWGRCVAITVCSGDDATTRCGDRLIRSLGDEVTR